MTKLPVLADNTGLTFAAKATFADWKEIGETLSRAGENLQWMLGDWWNFGVHRYGEGANEAIPRGYTLSTVRRYARTASQFSIERRRPELTFSHHDVVSRLEVGQQDEMLDTAVVERWPVEDLRSAVAALRSLDHGVPDPEDDSSDGEQEQADARDDAQNAVRTAFSGEDGTDATSTAETDTGQSDTDASDGSSDAADKTTEASDDTDEPDTKTPEPSTADMLAEALATVEKQAAEIARLAGRLKVAEQPVPHPLDAILTPGKFGPGAKVQTDGKLFSPSEIVDRGKELIKWANQYIAQADRAPAKKAHAAKKAATVAPSGAVVNACPHPKANRVALGPDGKYGWKCGLCGARIR